LQPSCGIYFILTDITIIHQQYPNFLRQVSSTSHFSHPPGRRKTLRPRRAESLFLHAAPEKRRSLSEQPTRHSFVFSAGSLKMIDKLSISSPSSSVS
jgi:hypothetical protein